MAAAPSQTPAKQLFAGSGPFALDDTLRPMDPAAYRQALLDNPLRMQMINKDPSMLQLMQGDLEAFAAAVQSQAQHYAASSTPDSVLDKSIDALRAEATVPRDTVQVYRQLHDVGLQYGPAFRLLRNIHVPDEADAALLLQS